MIIVGVGPGTDLSEVPVFRVQAAADGVVGDSAVEVLDQVDSGEVADLVAGGDSGTSEADQVVALPVPAGPTMHKLTAWWIHSSVIR